MELNEIPLEVLQQQEADAYQELSQAFIRYSLAHNNVQNRLREIREGWPTLFTD